MNYAVCQMILQQRNVANSCGVAVSHVDSSYSLSHNSHTITDPVVVIMLLVATQIIFILYVCVLCIPNPLTFPLAITKCCNLSFPFRIYCLNILHISIFYSDHKPQTQQLLIPLFKSKPKFHSLIHKSLTVSPLLSYTIQSTFSHCTE